MADNILVTPGVGKTIAGDEVSDGTLGTVTAAYGKIMDGTLGGTDKLTVLSNNAAKTDLSSIAGNTASAGNGASGTGTQRVTIANDSTGIIALTTSTASIGKLAANSGVDIGDVDVTSLPALPAGTNNIGDVDVLTLPAIPAGTNTIGKVMRPS